MAGKKGIIPPQVDGKQGRKRTRDVGDNGRTPVEIVDNEKFRAWERQPNEPITSYQAFSIYRDMGYHRTQRKVAEEIGTSVRSITMMSYRWRWSERLKLWDKWKDSIKREAEEREIKEMVKRHINGAMIFERASTMPAEAFLKRVGRSDIEREFEKVAVDDLFMLVTKGADVFQKMVNVERSSRGEPTEISKADLTSGGEPIKEVVRVIVPLVPPPPTSVDEKSKEADEDNE